MRGLKISIYIIAVAICTHLVESHLIQGQDLFTPASRLVIQRSFSLTPDLKRKSNRNKRQKVDRARLKTNVVLDEHCGETIKAVNPLNKKWPNLSPFFGTIRGEDNEVRCGGAIIGPQVVITSKTCGDNHTLTGGVANNLRIISGDHERSPLKSQAKVSWVANACSPNVSESEYFHRPFINGAYKSSNDMMLVKSDEDLNVSTTTRQLCLPTSKSVNSFNQHSECFFLGHFDNKAKNYPLEMRQVEILADCWMETESQICFRDVKDYSWSTCLHDSGGPIICAHENRWHLIGITSTIMRDCQPHTPLSGTYNVATKIKFVQQNGLLENCLSLLS